MSMIPVDQIRKGEIALRDVDPKSPDFLALVESIRQNGIINAISVCPVTNAETGENYYVIIDGLHRYTAACEAGLTEVPCTIKTADEAKILALQFQANMRRVDTKPAQYGKHIRRIMVLNPDINVATIANDLCVSTSYIMQRLCLTALIPEIQKAVDANQIPLNSAIALSKLPAEEQPEWVERAMTMESATFVENATARAKSIREAIRAGRSPEEEVFTPVARARRLVEVQDELKSGLVAGTYPSEDQKQAFLDGVRWAVSLDKSTLDQKEAAFIAMKKQKAEKQQQRKEELAKKKLEKNQAEAERLREEIAAGATSK